MKREPGQNKENIPSLKEGQVWTLADQCLEIKRVGKHLVEILITRKNPNKPEQKPFRLRKQLESIVTVQNFLRAHNAVIAEQTHIA